VLVTGAAGMLGSELLRCAPAGVEAVGSDLRPGPDVAAPGADLADAAAVETLFERHGPFQGVLHTAAWTAVDAAEDHEPEALRANAAASEVVARACQAHSTRLVAVGTDFVFDGAARTPYAEDAAPAPLSAYGRTKLAGERAALAAHPRGTSIVRTQWLYGPRGQHFPRTIVGHARKLGRLKVVDDQTGSPTSTLELAPALWDVLLSGAPGIYHAACEGACTWYGFTRAILATVGLGGVVVEPCTTAQFPRPARRPAYSVLGCAKLTRLRGRPLAPWREALERYLELEAL
jgi:dTDP-4-dehydrorhamnose reductase